MNGKKLILKIFCSFILIVAIVFSATLGYLAYAQKGDMKLEINKKQHFQTIDGWGASACWWSQIAGKSANLDNSIKYLYSKDGLGLNIYRYNIGGGENENDKTRIDNPWRRTESFYYYNSETGEYSLDFTRDEAAQNALKKALSYGCVDTVVLFANSPHFSMTKSQQASGGTEEYKSNLPKENYKEYAKYFLDITEYFISQGVPVKYISPINEPQWGWGGDWVGQEGCHYEPEEVAELLYVFSQEIDKRGINVKLSGPESGNIGDTTKQYFDLINKNAELMKNMGDFSYHSYFSDNDFIKKQKFGNWYKNNYENVKLQMSEWCELPCKHDVNDIKGALIMSRVISDDLSLTGVNSWSSWVGVNGIGIGDDGKNYSDGLLYASDDFSELYVAKRYYAYAHYSKFVPVGSKRIEISKNLFDAKFYFDKQNKSLNSGFSVNTVAFLTPNSDVVVVITNEGRERNVSLDISSVGMSVYQTTSEYSLKNIYNGQSKKEITLPENSITTMVYSKVK